MVATAEQGTGLEINHPEKIHLIYTIESEHINKRQLETIVDKSLSKTNINLEQRDDAQLFLRVEEHAGQYLLYLDFNREVQYVVADQCFRKDGFVWGRYVKDITDITALYDDVQLLMDEFIEAYIKANGL